MKRLLLPAGALVLVVTACGAGARPAPQLTRVGARVPTVRVLVAERMRAAVREARELEREFVPPPGALPDPSRHDHGGILNRPDYRPFGETAAARRYWRVDEPLAAVVTFLRAHDPRHFTRLGSAYGTERPGGSRYLMRTLDWNGSRYLDETIVARPGHTVIKVDTQVAWVYPRSPREIVPAATRRIVVHAPAWSLTVTNPAKVERIVRWFDALPVLPPGMPVACPLVLSPKLMLSFRDAAGAGLARARVPTTSAGICDPIRFKVGGRTRRPLIDQEHVEGFGRRLERLLGRPVTRTR